MSPLAVIPVMLKAREKALLLKTLKELKDEQYEEFLWHLGNDHGDKISRSRLENLKKDKMATVDCMQQIFCDKAMQITEDILEKIDRNDLKKTFSESRSKDDLITNDVEIRIVMVGKTGAGKSATGNTILGSEAFTAEFSPNSVTKTCNEASGVVDGRKVSVIDTPGLFDTGFSNTETIKEVTNCITFAAPGPHVFLAVIKLGRYTDEEKNVVAKIQERFGQSSDKYTMILFTHGDDLEGSIEECVNESPELNELISKYSDCYHVFNNESKDRSQVTKLLEKINQMVKKNGGSHYTNQMFQEAARKQDDLITNDEEIRIVLVGKTGAGKSATGNTILGPEAFESKFGFKSVTKTCSQASGVVDGRKVSVIDTPGLFDTKFSNNETIQEVTNCISCAAPGPHVFLTVIRLDRYTNEQRNVLAKIQKEFGDSDKYTMILFTHGDKLKAKTIEEFVNVSPELKELISKYSGRYHVFNNKTEDPSSQVTELLEKINQMVVENGGSHYTNQMFQEAARKQVRLVKQVQKAVADKDKTSLLDSLRQNDLGLQGVQDANARRYLDHFTNKTVVFDKEGIQRAVSSCNAAACAERQTLFWRGLFMGDIPTEGGLIIIIVAAVLGYLHWKKKDSVLAAVRQVQDAVAAQDKASLLDSLRLEALGLLRVQDANAHSYLDQLINKTVVFDRREIQRVVMSCNDTARSQMLAAVKQVQEAVAAKDEASLLDSLRLEALGLLGVQDDNAHSYLDQLTNKTVVLEREGIQRVVISCNAAAERQMMAAVKQVQKAVAAQDEASLLDSLRLEALGLLVVQAANKHRYLDYLRTCCQLTDKTVVLDKEEIQRVVISCNAAAEAKRLKVDFVTKHRSDLIQRVSRVDAILDLLDDEGVMQSEDCGDVRAGTTSVKKMRELFILLDKRGDKAKHIFYKGLEKNEPCLLDDLKSQ